MVFRVKDFAAVAVCLALASASTVAHSRTEPSAGGGILTAEVAAVTLARLHPDYSQYIHALRLVSAHAALVSPEPLYSGLVRVDGSEPRIAADSPATGRGARNDVLLFPSMLDPGRSPGWRELILDHEYFHARHLARGWPAPLVDFGSAEMNRSYYEALAWSYVVDRARQGVYGSLSAFDTREALATYRRHHQAIRREIMKRQPTAWAHYGRFLIDPEAGPAPPVGSAGQ